MRRRFTLVLVPLLVLAACGSSTRSAPTTAKAHPSANHQTSCGQYCEAAGESAGEASHGYPCPKPGPGKVIGCLNCPANGCVSLFNRSASATEGVLTVRVKCNVRSEPCVGAFLACDPNKFCFGTKPPGPQPAYGGRLAGSDFEVPAGQTKTIYVGMTALGNQLVKRPGGFKAAVYISLKDYGIDMPSTPTSPGITGSAYLQLTSAS